MCDIIYLANWDNLVVWPLRILEQDYQPPHEIHPILINHLWTYPHVWTDPKMHHVYVIYRIDLKHVQIAENEQIISCGSQNSQCNSIGKVWGKSKAKKTLKKMINM